MSDPVRQLTVIDEIDNRQNEVLNQLDELNARVEQLLKECTPNREQEEAVEA